MGQGSTHLGVRSRCGPPCLEARRRSDPSTPGAARIRGRRRRHRPGRRPSARRRRPLWRIRASPLAPRSRPATSSRPEASWRALCAPRGRAASMPAPGREQLLPWRPRRRALAVCTDNRRGGRTKAWARGPGMPGGVPMVIGRLRPQDERDVVTERRELAEEVSGVAGPAPFASRRFARSGKSLRSARPTAAAFADQSAYTKASSGSRSPSGLAAASARGTPPHGPSSGRRPGSRPSFERLLAFSNRSRRGRPRWWIPASATQPTSLRPGG